MIQIRNAIRYTGHIALFALCIEIGARVDDRITYGAPLWGHYGEDLLFGRDEDGIPRNVPGARFEKWKINSLGFRGPEIPREKPYGHWRIVCLGQSETLGLYEQEGGEWPAQLARILESKYPHVEIINASVVGTGRNSRAAYLKKYVLPLQPDVVILYMNALADGMMPDKPLIPNAAKAVPTRLPDVRLLSKVGPVLHAVLPENFDNKLRTWSVERRLANLEPRVLRGRPPLDSLPVENARRFESHVRRIVHILQENGIKPVLLTYPTLVNEANAKQSHLHIARERHYYPEFSERGMFDTAKKINSLLRKLARDIGVLLVDADSTMPKSTEFFVDCVHYSDKGAAFVAERVFEVTNKAGLLGPGEQKLGTSP